MLKVEISVAKTPKYAVRESGDTVEVIERPRGGLSVVMADGQRSGRGAKAISNIAVSKVISLLVEGVRDGAAARAAHDYLRTQRRGQVSAELIVLSADLETSTIVISRNSRCPVLLSEGGVWRSLDDPAEVVGVHARSRPVITELPLAAGVTAVAFSDGVVQAGSTAGSLLDVIQAVESLACQPGCSAQQLADGLLDHALSLEGGRPRDDISVAVLQVTEECAECPTDVRRMWVSLPVRSC